MADSNLYLEWFNKAHEDGLGAESIFKHRDAPPGLVCVHAQQMAEKYLKGFLVKLGITFPKIHDLLELATLLQKLYPEIDKLKNDNDLLTKFYMTDRYPSDMPDPNWFEAEQALVAAVRIKDFVLAKIQD